jgi:hypothetical protein
MTAKRQTTMVAVTRREIKIPEMMTQGMTMKAMAAVEIKANKRTAI